MRRPSTNESRAGDRTPRALRADTRGVSYVEYLILVGVVALLAIGAWQRFGGAISTATTQQATKVRLLEGSEPNEAPGSGPGAPVAARHVPAHRAVPRPAVLSDGVVSGGANDLAAANDLALSSEPVHPDPSRAPATGAPAPGGGPAQPPPSVAQGRTAQARAPPPAAPVSGWRSNPAVQFAAGVALGGLQGWLPGGFAAGVVPLPTKSSELGRGVGETAMGVAQVIVGLGATGAGGTAAVAGGAAVPVTGGASLAVTAGGGALATAGVASMAQGAVNVVAGAATLNRALHMSGDSDGAPPTTEPSPEPKPGEGKPRGPRAKPHPNDKDPENARALQRQNESADTIAKKGRDVEQLGESNSGSSPGTKHPDFKIDGQPYDNYAPTSGSPRNIASNVADKVNQEQAKRIVLNLDDSPATTESVVQQFKDYPVDGLEDLVIVRNGEITNVPLEGR